MREFELRVGFPTGTILIGGHSALPVGASSAHARDHHGRPVVPATALRGALRESLEALLRGVGRSACDSGTGVDPGRTREGEASAPAGECRLDGGERCVACRLFGSRAAALPEGARVFSSLILGDAQLVGDEAPGWTDRQHVAVARAARSAEDQRLFLRRTPNLHERTLVARGYSIEREFDAYLEAAVRATTHLGSGRSVGLARVELELRWQSELELSAQPPMSAAGEHVRIRVTLKSPTLLGGAQVGDNYRPTRSEVSGSVLRGAIGFAIARTHSEADTDPDFAALIDERSGAQFGVLYPVAPAHVDGPRPVRPGPWPLTARSCKSHPRAHGVVDTLLDRIAAASLTSIEQVEAARALALRSCSVSAGSAKSGRCGAPLRAPSGSRACAHAPSKRVVTRVSIDRRSSSAREGALFSYELLEPGAVFEGTIRNVPESARALLGRALDLPIHLGRGACSGWGAATVEVLPDAPLASLEQRGRAFADALHAHFEAIGLACDDIDKLVPITLLSPMLPDDDDDGRVTLARSLGDVDDWLVVARRFVRDGGWDQRTGRPFAELAVVGGAVYVARLRDSWRDPATLARLRALELQGFGRRRHQGYGHAILFDPFILNRRQEPVNHSEATQQVRSLRKDLVIAAESAIHAAFAGDRESRPPSKTQFSRLIGVCGEATCAEEIENYLRYQAGRDAKNRRGSSGEDGWRIEFVKLVIKQLTDLLERHAKLGAGLDDRARVEAWRRYATYLARAYTYEHAVHSRLQRQQHGGGRRRG